MDVSTAFGVSFLGFQARSFDLKQAYPDHKQCSCGSVKPTSDNLVTELGNALTEMLHVQDAHVQLLGQSSPSDENNVCHQEKDCSTEELKASQSKHLNAASTHKNLYKCATSPCSKTFPSCVVSVEDSGETSDTLQHAASCTDSNKLVCTRSISLPTPPKLVSALKGSRGKQGITQKNLSVRWAPDVYDPPATSLSHTVKSCNQQRSRNKKTIKHKHKGRSSRGNNSENKHRKHVSNTEFRSKSFSTCGRMLHDGYNQSPVELMDLAVTGQDSNCGSSFLRTSLAKVHNSVAEAT